MRLNCLVDNVLIEAKCVAHTLSWWVEMLLMVDLGLIFSDVFEIIENIWDWFFVHRYSLLQHVKSSWNYVELTYNFFKGLGKLFSSSNLLMMSFVSVQISFMGDNYCSWSVCFTNSWSCLLLGWEDCGRNGLAGKRKLLTLLNIVSGLSWWGGRLGLLWGCASNHLALSVGADASCRRLNLWLLNGWSVASEFFDILLLLIVKIAFPNHHNWVGSCRAEVVSARREVYCCWCAFMSKKCVKNMALSKIPDLKSRIIGCWEKESAVGVEYNLVHLICVSIVMLEKPLAPNVPNFDRLIRPATCQAGSIRMELKWGYSSFQVAKAVDQGALSHVPELHSLIIWARPDESCVWRKLGGPDPILMSIDWELEFSIWCVEDL